MQITNKLAQLQTVQLAWTLIIIIIIIIIIIPIHPGYGHAVGLHAYVINNNATNFSFILAKYGVIAQQS